MPSSRPSTTTTLNPPDLQHVYSVEQIKIPPGFPDILKNYTKFILQTQPTDIIQASVEYFTNLNRTVKSASKKGPTSLQLEMLFHRFSQKNETELDLDTLLGICNICQIGPDLVNSTVQLGEFAAPEGGVKIPWLKFWSLLITAGSSDLVATLETAANIIAGENGKVQAKTLVDIFTFLASRDKTIGQEKISAIVKRLTIEPEIHCLVATDIFKAEFGSSTPQQ